MKILQIVPYFYPAWSYGGPAKLVYDTCEYFVTQGHQVIVFTSDAYDENSRMPEELRVKKEVGFSVFYFRNIFNEITYKYNIFCTPRLFFQSLLVVPNIDVIHLHDFYTPHNLWLGLLAKVFSKPYVLSVHGCLETARVAQRSLFKKFFLQLGGTWLLRNASKVIASSDNEIDAYLEYGVKKENIILLGHGVNPEEFQTVLSKAESRKSWKLSQSDIVITFLGRIHKIKGLDILVNAIPLIKTKKVSFVIAGSDDGYLTELQGLIRKLKLKNISLPGTCFGQRKAELFKASDIFVYPSYSEGFSLGILEAGAAGLPLVITTGCHFDEVKTTKSGLVVQPTPQDLAEGLEKMIEDTKFRETSRLNIKKLIQKKYSMESIGNSLLNTYSAVLKR
ncbi:hypothetical protein BH10PAT2_BH10PAT2_0280 [soil metagenome]